MSVTKKSKKGRPRRGAAVSKGITVRLTPDERNQWATAAHYSGFNDLSGWVRAICNQYVRNYKVSP